MLLEVTIRKFDPEKDKAPYFRTYSVEADPDERFLDVLNRIKWEQDGTLTYRKSCAHGVCGSCAMFINGENLLACTTLVKDLKTNRIKVEPLPGADIDKDLAINQDDFWEQYRKVKPYLINDDPPPARERLQSPEEFDRIEESTKCILCGACTYSCPSKWADPDYLGPAAMLKAYRFIFDSRDQAGEERLGILDSKKGIFKCYTIFNCVEACPKEINLTWHFSQIKKKLTFMKY